MKTSLAVLALVLLLTTPGFADDPLQAALAAAGDNRPELERVLDHYRARGDAQKLRAAEFLIENMPEQGFIEAALFDEDHTEIPFDALEHPNLKAALARLDELEAEHGTLDFHRKRIDLDLEVMTAEYLIENIDLAFAAWRTRPWAKDVPFDLFLEHILPYRGSNEPLGRWRRALFAEFADLPGELEDPTDMRAAAKLVRKRIGKQIRFSDLYYVHPTDQGYEEMVESGLGRCEDITNFATYGFRANAILSASDYTPYWANRDNNHAWEVILDADGTGHAKLSNVAAKVYRKTFAIQRDSLGCRKTESEDVPRWLAGKHYRDVTKDYVETTDVTVALTVPVPEGHRFAYLAVFNGGEWRAIHWGRIGEGRVTFDAMGRGIAYLPAYRVDGKTVPAAGPFLLRKDGTIESLDRSIGASARIEVAAVVPDTPDADTARVLPRIAVEPGKSYELRVWEDGWKTLGRYTVEPSGAPVVIEAAPGRLYWLVEPEGRRLERIFTVEDGRPRYW